MELDTDLDPDPHFHVCGFETLDIQSWLNTSKNSTEQLNGQNQFYQNLAENNVTSLVALMIFLS